MADYISKYSGAQIDLSVASGSTVSGKIIIPTPVNSNEAATKQYVDNNVLANQGGGSLLTNIQINGINYT